MRWDGSGSYGGGNAAGGVCALSGAWRGVDGADAVPRVIHGAAIDRLDAGIGGARDGGGGTCARTRTRRHALFSFGTSAASTYTQISGLRNTRIFIKKRTLTSPALGGAFITVI